MATKIDSAEKAFEAASAQAAAVTTSVADKAADVTAEVAKVAAPVVKAVKVAAKKAVAVKAPVKAKTVAVKAKAAAAKKPAVVKAAAKKVAPIKAKIAKATKPVKTTTTKLAATSPVAAAQKGLKTMNDTVKKFADEAKTRFETMTADMNGRSKEAMEKASKLAEDAVEFQKANIEAIVESGKIAAKGMEAMGQEAAEYSRKSFETATAALKSLSSVKSPTDFFKLHSDYVRQSFDSIVAETSKNTEAMLKLAGEVAQPISNRVAVAVEKVKIAA